MVKIKESLLGVFKVLFSLFLMLLGLGVLMNPMPIPGMDRNGTTVVAILLIGIGGALWKILGIRAETRVKAKAWREVMEE